jgi:N-acetylglucosamine-6-sulfatase
VSALAASLVVGLLASCGGQPAKAPATDSGVSRAPSDAPTSAPVPAPVPPTRSPPPRAPNLVVVMMDDMRWDELQFAPHARRLIADRGITFENSFAPFPLCCPSRASFLTGQYAHNHGVLSHVPPYGFGSLRDNRSLGTRLQRAGYRTALIGKYLNGYGIQPSRVTGRPSATYVPRGWTDWMVGLDNGGGFGGSTYDYFDYTENVNGVVTRTTGRYSSEVIGSHAIDLIGDYAGTDKPFFLWITPVAPHHGNPVEADDPPRETGGTGNHDTPARPDWVKGRFDVAITHAPGVPVSGADPEGRMLDKPRFMRLSPPLSPADTDGILAVARQRAEAIYAWDRQLGRIVRQLRRTGELDRTVLMFTSDNGYLLGEHRFMSGKILPHEPSLRVPLLVAGPGVEQGRRWTPATTMDLTATLLDLAGAAPWAGADGESLRPVLGGPDRPWKRPILTEGYFPDLPRKVEGFPELTEVGLRTGRWKYVRWASGQTELYDLASDPNELQSLHRSRRHRTLLARLDKLWELYADCRADTCRAALPGDLQTTPQQLARIGDDFDRARERHYGR